MNLPQQRERVTVDGLGNVGVGKYTKTVEKSGKSGIINKYKGKGIPIEKTTEISKDVFDSVDKATKKVTSDFRMLEDYSEPIVFGDVGAGALASNEFLTNTGKNKITLSKTAFSNSAELERCLRQDYINGISYETAGIESLVAHEMGHNAHIALALKRAGIQYGKPLSEIDCFLFFSEYERISQEVYLAAFTTESFSEIQAACRNQLGSMTVGSPHELIAQSFGNYYYGVKKFDVAERIVKHFIKELL